MAQVRPGLAPWAPTAIIALMIDCSPPLSLPPGHAHNVSDTHDTVPSGYFYAGQTATGVVLLCEAFHGGGTLNSELGDSKHCTKVGWTLARTDESCLWKSCTCLPL